MTVEAVKDGDAYKPNADAPGTQDEHELCEAEIQGMIKMPCCCPRLYTRTQILSLGPQTEAQLVNLLQSTVSNYEASGYLVLAHSLIDTGAGWALGLTIGWYA